MVNRITAVVILAVLVLATVGCGSDDRERYPGSGSKTEKSWAR